MSTPVETTPDVLEEFKEWLHHERASAKQWTWLESNPPVFNNYIKQLGVLDHELVDIYGTDPGLLAMVPQPVRAVLLLFPMNIHPRTSPSVDEKVVWHTNQTVRGACGSVGLLHAVMNNTHLISLDEKKFYSQFYESTRDLDSRTRAHRFYENDEIERVHAETAQAEGTVEDSSYSAGQSLHFTAFVHVNGGLYELDGHNQGPVKHGECDPDNLLPRAAQLIQTNFMDKDPGNINFTMMALVPSDSAS